MEDTQLEEILYTGMEDKHDETASCHCGCDCNLECEVHF